MDEPKVCARCGGVIKGDDNWLRNGTSYVHLWIEECAE